MKIPYNILIQIKMSVRPYFKGFTLIFFFYNCRKQDYNGIPEKEKDGKKADPKVKTSDKGARFIFSILLSVHLSGQRSFSP